MGTVAKLAAGGATHLIASTAYATCTTAAGTAAKVATIQDSQAFTLIVGTTIHVYFQYSNTASAPTLNVNSTGALPIYKYGTTAAGTNGNTSWSAGAVVSFTYNKNNLSTGCWVMNDHIDNTDTDVNAMQIHYYNNVKAKTALTAEKIIVGDASGYSIASSGVTFNISYPILWTTAAVSAGSANYNAIYSQIYDRNLTNIKSGFTSTADSGIYLVATISGVIATVDSTIITDTLPTSEDGKVYIRLGKLGNNSTGSNYFIFEPEHPMFWYYHGEVVPYDGTANLLLDMIYPVGSIYMSVNNVNPGTYLTGTTWVEWGAGRVPVGIDTTQTEFNTVEKTGGEKTHTLTVEEMPAHDHLPYESAAYFLNYNTTYKQVQIQGGSYNNCDLQRHSGSTGGNSAHNNMQPYITCYMWKRTA